MPIKLILNMPHSDQEIDRSGPPTSHTTAHDVAMQENEQQPTIEEGVAGEGAIFQQTDGSADVVMSEGVSPAVRQLSPAILPGATVESHRQSVASGSHTPSRTPNANLNGNFQINENTSRATSQHPEPTPVPHVSAANFPKTAALHGAPTRQYLNGKVTTVLLEGMKVIAKDQPKDPLRVLGEYLLQRSREIEGT